MYKLISVCLALSLVFSETNTIKNKSVEKLEQTELKKAKSSTELEVAASKLLESKSIAISKESQKREKKYKKNKPGYKDIQIEEASHSASKTTNTLTERSSSPTSDELILRDKQSKNQTVESSSQGLNYIQGPKPSKTSSSVSLLSREHQGLFFSEYAEGSSNHKYLEIYNNSGETVDLTSYAYPSVANAPTTAGEHEYWNEFEAGASVAAGDVYVICHGSSDQSILDECDETHTYLSNGDDGYALVKGVETDFEVVDVIGQSIFEDTYADPGSGWDVAGVSNATKDHVLVRKANVQAGNIDWVASAGTNVDDSEWIVLEIDTWDNLGLHTIDEVEEGVYLSEGFEGDFPPTGWESSGDGPWAQDSGDDYGPGFAASGTYAAFFNDYDYSTGTFGFLVSPVVDLANAVTPKLKFQYWDSGGSDAVEVQVSNSDGSYTTVYTTPTSTVGWEELSYDLSTYVGQAVSIRFVGTSVYGTSNPHIDDVSVAEPPTYPIAELSTGVINFGDVFVGASKSVDFAITNSGGGDLNGSISSDNVNFTVSTLPGRIAPNETVTVTATYTAASEDDDSGYLIFTHNGDSSPDSVMVSGSGTLDILSEGFEGTWSGDPSAPAGWSQVTVSGAAPWDQYASSFYANSGLNSARAPASSGNSASPSEHYLISPGVDLTDGYYLKFWFDGSSSGSSSYYTNIEVLISSQNTDVTTGWTSLARYIQYDTGEGGEYQNASYEEKSIDLSSYSGVNYIAFKAVDKWGYSVYMDDVRVEPIPARPVILYSSEIVQFSPTLVSSSVQSVISLSNVGAADANIVLTSTNDKFVATSTSSVVSPGTPIDMTITYTPTAEIEDTGYIIITHEGDSSPDSVMVSGSGSPNPLTEGFEGGWSGSPSAPTGWSQITVSGAAPWDQYTSSFGAHTGENSARAPASSGNSTSPSEHYLISPGVDLTDGFNLKLWIDGSTSGSASYYTNIEVLISSQNADVTTGWTSLARYIQYDTGEGGEQQTGSYEQKTISLADYSGVNYIAFKAVDRWGYSVYVDDVTIEPLPQSPIISVSPTSLGFMATAIGSSDIGSVSIANNGPGDLSGTIVYSDGFTGPASFGASDASIDISFSPTASGITSGTATITSNGGDDVVISLSGNAGVSVATWDLDADGDGEGDWPVGWETVNYDGNGDGWEFFGGGGHTGDGYASAEADGFGTVNADFLISPKYSVASGDIFSFYASDDNSFGSITYPDIMTVHVSPTGGMNPEDFTVELDSVFNMGPFWLPYSYDLTEYVGSEIRLAIVYRGEYGYALNVDDVAGPEIIQEAGPLIYDYPMNLDFAMMINVGETDTLLFDYFNNGGSDLEVTAVSFVGPFSLSSDVTLPIVTTPGSIGSFKVVFSPVADSAYVGSMTVANNSGDISVPLYGAGFGGVYYEDFGSVGVGDDGNPALNPWSAGWTVSDDGVRSTDNMSFTNGTGQYWRRTYFTSGSDPFMYHTYDASFNDADTAISGPIVLPAVEGEHYELDTYEYMYFGSYALMCGIAVSTDGGATFTMLGEADYSQSGWYNANYNLTGYSGQTIHLALIYTGQDANTWAVSELAIRSKPDPIIPIFARSKPIFPATKIGESSSRVVYYANVGSGSLSADITYPASMSGPTSITDLAAGVQDSMVITYTPTVPGVETGTIVVDGSASGAAVSNIPFDANAGELAFDLETQSAGWRSYSLAGEPWVAPSGAVYSDTWRWYGGTGHSGPNYYGVYSYFPYWGGVDDYLVSPRYSLSDASEVLSFFASGGYGDGTDMDSMNVWVSTERPIMGFIESEGGRVDTGFVNTDAFTLVYDSVPSDVSWDPVNIDLTSYGTDVWVMIQSVQYYDENGVESGWMLKVDDLATPDIYLSQDPILNAVVRYDFGTTSPAGDTVSLGIINSGVQDLIIDSLELANGSAYNLDLVDVEFPVTVMQDSIVNFPVVFAPYEDGPAMDTLIYHSNYTAGNLDANGYGTDHTKLSGFATNAPPSAVNLIGPADETLLTIDDNNAEGQTGIFWTNSIDPDGTPVEYVLELVFENTGDTLDTAMSVTNFFLQHAEVLEYMEEVGVTQLDISWDVYAEDGFEYSSSSNGPWSLTIDGGWALSVDNNTIPEVFALHNNYPNPFNPITNIRYDIPEASDVRIDIYDLVGKKVKTLVSKQHQPGRYKIQWNATNEFGSAVATGMYIYKIQAKDFVSVKKLLLMK